MRYVLENIIQTKLGKQFIRNEVNSDYPATDWMSLSYSSPKNKNCPMITHLTKAFWVESMHLCKNNIHI